MAWTPTSEVQVPAAERSPYRVGDRSVRLEDHQEDFGYPAGRQVETSDRQVCRRSIEGSIATGTFHPENAEQTPVDLNRPAVMTSAPTRPSHRGTWKYLPGHCLPFADRQRLEIPSVKRLQHIQAGQPHWERIPPKLNCAASHLRLEFAPNAWKELARIRPVVSLGRTGPTPRQARRSMRRLLETCSASL